MEDILLACQAFPTERLQPLLQEASDELTAIFVRLDQDRPRESAVTGEGRCRDQPAP